MREGLVPSCVCVCVCVCVCSSGNDCGYLISHQWEELNLLVMYVMVCTCTVLIHTLYINNGKASIHSYSCSPIPQQDRE